MKNDKNLIIQIVTHSPPIKNWFEEILIWFLFLHLQNPFYEKVEFLSDQKLLDIFEPKSRSAGVRDLCKFWHAPIRYTCEPNEYSMIPGVIEILISREMGFVNKRMKNKMVFSKLIRNVMKCEMQRDQL